MVKISEKIQYLYPRDWIWFIRAQNVSPKPVTLTFRPYEKTVVSQRCDHAVVILAEKLFCDCGWPYNLIIPRGSKKGSTFKLFVYVSDGTNDLVRTDTQCGSTLLCGGEKWTDKIPDIKPFGYPFDRPFKDGSFYKTFQGMKNVAHTDITIKWVEDFPEV
ncbi:unnamed protein product [Rhizophagus irregularis]|nr:unnamed protein product [Rhizophagus irregularis]